jgi:hypothetical protein
VQFLHNQGVSIDSHRLTYTIRRVNAQRRTWLLSLRLDPSRHVFPAIGIGPPLAGRPHTHHRRYGSRIRRFGWSGQAKRRLVPVPAASYPPRGRQFSPLLYTISPHLCLRPLPGHRYRLASCPWLPFTVTWLGRDLPARASSPASSRAMPGTQRPGEPAGRQRRTVPPVVGAQIFPF